MNFDSDCRKTCKSYEQQQELYCYDKSCPTGFTPSTGLDAYARCKRNKDTYLSPSSLKPTASQGRRWDRRKHDSTCTDYENIYDNVIRTKDAAGIVKCKTDCSSTDTKILGVCWPEAKLVLSIQDIVDVVTDIITGLVGGALAAIEEILKFAIEKIVIPLLRSLNIPILDTIADALQLIAAADEVIKQWLCDTFNICFPEFPR